ncbi:MAG: hypothetical protein HYT76_07485 [Deltaproteobacteria bacterium]|nr:hypothetical protein [Deltaproteobacteria bacterium]
MADTDTLEARRRKYESGITPPPAEDTLDRRAAKATGRLAPEEKKEEAPPPASANESGFRSVRIRVGHHVGFSSIATPHPAEEQGTSERSAGEALDDLPVDFHVSYFWRQDVTPLKPRFGVFVSYRNFQVTQEVGDQKQTSTVHLGGIGGTVAFGPFLSPLNGEAWKALLQWGESTRIGIGGVQVSGGIAVGRIGVETTRPNPDEPAAKGSEWVISSTLPIPAYLEAEVILLSALFGKEDQPWGQVTLGVDNFFVLKKAEFWEEGSDAIEEGEEKVRGNFRAIGYLTPTLGLTLFW